MDQGTIKAWLEIYVSTEGDPEELPSSPGSLNDCVEKRPSPWYHLGSHAQVINLGYVKPKKKKKLEKEQKFNLKRIST